MKVRMLKVFKGFAEDIMGEKNIKIQDLSTNKLTKRLKSDSFDGNVAEAIEIYILMMNLSDEIVEA